MGSATFKNDRYPSRYLNDQRGFFGLWMTDFAFAILVFAAWSRIFEETTAAYFAIPMAVASLIVLSPIRLKTRRKIIRDFISYYLRGSLIYDPRQRSLFP